MSTPRASAEPSIPPEALTGISDTSSQSARRRTVRRVGHKGAAAIAPGNTPAAFDAALAAGVDMIELDVLPERLDGSGELFIAHDYEDLGARRRVPLQEALSHLASSRFAQVELDVDIKLPGYGERVVSALESNGLSDRALLSCTYPRELDAIRSLHPQLRLGWSVPRARRDYTANAYTIAPALIALQVARRVLPGRARKALSSGRFDAIMAHWRLVTSGLLEAVRVAGGELYVWTVDDAARIAKLAKLGVDGIITNDPRLFHHALPDVDA